MGGGVCFPCSHRLLARAAPQAPAADRRHKQDRRRQRERLGHRPASRPTLQLRRARLSPSSGGVSQQDVVSARDYGESGVRFLTTRRSGR